MRLPILIIASLVAVSGCVSKHDPPDLAPTGVTAVGGDGVALLTWDQLPDLTYWIFYAPGNSVSPGQVGSIAIKNAVSPRAVTGLLNDTPYAFVMNATNQDSAAGPNSQVVRANTRLAGDFWTKGSEQGTAQGLKDLNALAFNGAARYVTVGDGTTIFAGDFNYGHTDPVGVTEWFGPATTPPITWFLQGSDTSTPGGAPPAGFAPDFKAVIFNGAFVALGATGEVATSADGLNWVTHHAVVTAGGLGGITGGLTGLTGIAFGVSTTSGFIYIAVGSGGQMYTTTDLTALVDWTPVTSLGTTSNLTSITFLSGFFIVTGEDGTLLASVDGANWTQQTITPPLPPGTTLRSAAYMTNAGVIAGAVSFVAVGDGGVIVSGTRDPSNITQPGIWTSTLIPGAPNLRSVAVGGATGFRFLAVGQGGTAVFGDSVVNNVTTGVQSLVNPIQWSVASQPQPGDLSSVHFVTGQYLAVGPAGGNAVCH